METITSTYLSPKTGTQYLIVPKNDRRAYYEDGQQLWRDDTIFQVVLDGNPVQFSLTVEGIPGAVAHFEGEDDGWYCLGRD